MKYLKPIEKGILSCMVENEHGFCRIDIKDGQIIKTYSGNTFYSHYDSTHKPQFALMELSVISPKCFMEVFKTLRKGTYDYHIAKKLLKAIATTLQKEAKEKLELSNEALQTLDKKEKRC